MNPYDQAHALARSLKESEEYREFSRLKEVAYDDATNKALLDEYKKLQFRLQAKMASGESMPNDDMQRLQQIPSLQNKLPVGLLGALLHTAQVKMTGIQTDGKILTAGIPNE